MDAAATQTDNRLPSDRLKLFREALETLYLKGNMGGRLHFAKDWPAAAQHIFGKELCRMDRDGARDKETRARLEDEAEERRVIMLYMAETLEEKSVIKGVLQTEYVREIVTGLGRETALCLYAEWVVNKFLPPPPGEGKPAAASA